MINIFLIEDNLADVALFKHAVQEIIPKFQLKTIRELPELRSVLDNQFSPDKRNNPQLIFSDYFLNAFNAFDILKVVREHPYGQHASVCILSSLDQIEIVDKLYHAGADAFLHKSGDYDHLVSSLRHTITALLRPAHQK